MFSLSKGPRMRRLIALLALCFALFTPTTMRAAKTPRPAPPEPQTSPAKSPAPPEPSSALGNPDVQVWVNTNSGDFGILKWSTSAVCFGPPWAQQTSTLYLSVSLGLEAGVGLESQGGAIRADSVGV